MMQEPAARPLVKTLSVKVDEFSYNKVKALAAANNISMAQVMRDAIGDL
jgi:hypothetical protein